MKRLFFFLIAISTLLFTACDKDNDSQLKEGRWNCYRDPQSEDFVFSMILKDGVADIYIIAWGDHLKAPYTYNENILHFDFSISQAWDARTGTAESWGWEAGNMDPETFKLSDGYTWWEMDQQTFEDDVNLLQDMEFIVSSDSEAAGGFGVWKRVK